MKNIPGCVRERRYSVTHVLPNAESLAASEVRSSEVAARLVREGYKLVGRGKDWTVVLDRTKARRT